MNTLDESLLRTILKKNETEIAHRVIDDQAVIIHLKRNTFNVLNTVATEIWRLIDGKLTLREIIGKIFQEFDISWSTLDQDCLAFVREMAGKDLLNPISVESIPNLIQLEQTDGKLFIDLRSKAIVKQIPLTVHFDLTHECNLDCVHCYVVHGDCVPLGFDRIKDIIEQLADVGVLYLTLGGGEVLARKDFFAIAQYARKFHFALKILTNGTLIDQVMADEIASLNPEMVAISIYSTKPEVHDRITRVEGSFKKTISAAEMLRSNGVRLKISTAIMKGNIDDYQSIYALSVQLGAMFQADYRIVPKTDGNKAPLVVNIDEKNLSRLLDNPLFTESNTIEPQETYSEIFNQIPCGAGHASCYITPSGDVYPCIQLPINCGNLQERAFAEIWKDSSVLSGFRSMTISDLISCSRCEFFRHCRICIGLNYVEEGNIFSPSKRVCQEARIMKGLNRERR